MHSSQTNPMEYEPTLHIGYVTYLFESKHTHTLIRYVIIFMFFLCTFTRYHQFVPPETAAAINTRNTTATAAGENTNFMQGWLL